jgi:hypothetical protein
MRFPLSEPRRLQVVLVKLYWKARHAAEVEQRVAQVASPSAEAELMVFPG